MGREIRRVPPNWEHPKVESTGRYIPMHDKDYETALQEWWDGRQLWKAGTHPDQQKEYYDPAEDTYEEWHGGAPQPDEYRPVFTEEPTAYQIYETVSEGTPVSRVFKTLDDLTQWLIDQGYSEGAAEQFAKGGYAPSAMFGNGFMYKDIESLNILNDED